MTTFREHIKIFLWKIFGRLDLKVLYNYGISAYHSKIHEISFLLCGVEMQAKNEASRVREYASKRTLMRIKIIFMIILLLSGVEFHILLLVITSTFYVIYCPNRN